MKAGDPLSILNTRNELSQVSFSIYSTEELRKLSVLEVTELTTFDAFSHPNRNGLYDNRLGPVKNDVCGTCGRSNLDCDGHVGHITLPLPVFNPVLLKPLSLLLKITCFECRHLLVSPTEFVFLKRQMQALDYGLDYLAKEMAEELEMLSGKQKGEGGKSNKDEVADLTVNSEAIRFDKKLLKKIKTALGQRGPHDQGRKQVRSLVEVRYNVLKSFLHSGKRTLGQKYCLKCFTARLPVQLQNNSVYIINRPAKYKAEVGQSDPNVTISDSIISKNSPTLTPEDARILLRQLWENEKKHIVYFFPFLANVVADPPTDCFFWDVIHVASAKFKPLRHQGDQTFEHEQRVTLGAIMKQATVLAAVVKDAKNVEETKEKSKLAAKVHFNWSQLQTLCNRLYDTDLDKSMEKKNPGVRQIIEKKEGLFRMNMMGKRVNYAARSVISPDPYITANEVGIPIIFAKKLTYPEPLTPHNLEKMRMAVMNGPNAHPGAVAIQFKEGYITRLSDNVQQRCVMADRLEAALGRQDNSTVIVFRHLVSGDVLLFNRQPTLHKPSIMAHVARVLPRERTLRMHYSNCKSYNADFDGDEMNAHFPQSELARSEAYNIAAVDRQYLVPKDGTPLSGLIQDHIVSALLLSIRGTFFTREDYHELVYGALSFLNTKIITVPPAIVRPVNLWTGKQLITTLILNIVPKGRPLPYVNYPCKVKPKAFVNSEVRPFPGGNLRAGEMCESRVIIMNGEHLCGLIDKSSIGNQHLGLIHVCYEIYGGIVSTYLLTAFARLATNYLQCFSGLTLGIHDILVIDGANKRRLQIVEERKDAGFKAVSNALSVASEEETEESLKDKMQRAHVDRDPLPLKMLDGAYKGETNEINNQISSVCLDGLVKKFPTNNLQLMIQSGAKGGTVNALQISCLLGQIELEGRRVPLMMSGRTLPSFVPYDMSPRAGGFISGRFLTGIRPQEFFFHCMAGREGLIDTAVKTSRSGYLQRCLIKHMEGLMVHYDMTVRDADGSVVQYLYGEDGIDILKSQLVREEAFPTLIRNHEALVPPKEEYERIKSDLTKKRISKHQKKIRKWIDEFGQNRTRVVRGSPFLDFCLSRTSNEQPTITSRKSDVAAWFDLDKKEIQEMKSKFKCPDPLNSVFKSDTMFGIVTERLEEIISNYVSNNPDNLLIEPEDEKPYKMLRPIKSMETSESCDFKPISKNLFYEVFCHRFMRSLAEPGEAVGLLAAQSIGEPSTQMTLNTFHFAGRGEMNVTLGIPRLREIIQTASANISTPSMDVPFRTDIQVSETEAENVRMQLSAVKVSDILESVDVTESVKLCSESYLRRDYTIVFNFLEHKFYKKKFDVSASQALLSVERKFIRTLCNVIDKQVDAMKKTNSLYDHSLRVRDVDGLMRGDDKVDEKDDGDIDLEPRGKSPTSDDKDEDEVSSDEDEPIEGDTLESKKRQRHDQDMGYEEPDEEEKEKNNSDIEDDNESSQDKLMSLSDTKSEDEPKIESAEKKIAAKKRLVLGSTGRTKSERIDDVRMFHDRVVDYNFDDENNRWSCVTLSLKIAEGKLDMGALIEELAKKTFIHKQGTINRAFLVDDKSAPKGAFAKMIKTEGVSFLPLVQYSHILDMNRVYSNDIHAIAKTYGIEAASQAIRREMANVFAVYGIVVDPRHLSLVADYMTFSGDVKGMNRRSLISNASPIQQMTFETTTNFLKDAALVGFHDELSSPSARIFAGRPTGGGTGCFTLMNPKMEMQPSAKKSIKKTSFSTLPTRSSNRNSKTPAKRLSRMVIPMSSKKKKIQD